MKSILLIIFFYSISILITMSQNTSKDLLGDWWTITECGKCATELKNPYQEISFNDSLVIFYSICYSPGIGKFKIIASDSNSYTVSKEGKDIITTFQKKDNITLVITSICLDTNMEQSWILKQIDKKEYTLTDYLKDKDLDKYITHAQKRANKFKTN